MRSINYFIIIYFIFFSFYSLQAQNQEVKTLKAYRVQQAPKIDGNPDDLQWSKAEPATGFYMFVPGDGEPLPKEYYTEVRVVYDDFAIYVLAVMNDPDPENIPRVFGLRDQFVPADNFAVLLNPLMTPNNTYMFLVTASGAQGDSNHPEDGGLSWDAVWKSDVAITKTGWVAEMAIPYSALRFQNDPDQTWGITFFRHIERTREDYTWTYIDKRKRGDLSQFLGRLTNLKNLKPPVRLGFYPYSSAVYNHKDDENDMDFGMGLDLKYGLSESYTLDATLIPDFSDTPYDELTLNLGPFEQYYDEKRQFFTEGFDLFNKGRLFYSRRIGDTPIDYYSVYDEIDPNEIVVENPEKVQLINALKISGRSKNGLGIGFFNSITDETVAIVEDTLTHTQREIVTEPYANYNVFVMDYNYKGNSSVSLINTNVLRQGDARDANVTAFAWDLYGQNNTLSAGGSVAMSLINEDHEFTEGFKFVNYAKKQIDKHGFSSLIRIYDDKFDINDLGYLRKNNYANFDFGYTYTILKPTQKFNAFRVSFNAGFDHQYKPFLSVQNDYRIKISATNKKYLSYGVGSEYVTDSYDYYEPRVEGRYYLDKKHISAWAYLSSDYRKKLALDLKVVRSSKFDDPQNSYTFNISPRFRFNNQFKLNYSFEYSKTNDEKGYVDIVGEDIIFGNRQQKTVTNTLGANYYFTTKSAINLNFRYYWAPVDYDSFYLLEYDGSLTPTDMYNVNNDINYNVWNVDLSYIWEFAPGSKLSLMYRNTIINYDQMAQLSFFDNFENLMEQPLEHTFVLKVTYYIDYNTLKNKWF